MPKQFLRPTTKYILGKAMQGTLPDEVLRQPKAGFGAPVDCWLANDLREMVHDLLAECRVQGRGYFEPNAVRQLIRALQRPSCLVHANLATANFRTAATNIYGW
jgi:asparagine synthetase B (glutamine-hydrolysing)